MERYFKNEIDLWLKQSTDSNKEIYYKHLLNMFDIFMKCDEGHSGMSINYAANAIENMKDKTCFNDVNTVVGYVNAIDDSICKDKLVTLFATCIKYKPLTKISFNFNDFNEPYTNEGDRQHKRCPNIFFNANEKFPNIYNAIIFNEYSNGVYVGSYSGMAYTKDFLQIRSRKNIDVEKFSKSNHIYPQPIYIDVKIIPYDDSIHNLCNYIEDENGNKSICIIDDSIDIYELINNSYYKFLNEEENSLTN